MTTAKTETAVEDEKFILDGCFRLYQLMRRSDTVRSVSASIVIANKYSVQLDIISFLSGRFYHHSTDGGLSKQFSS